MELKISIILFALYLFPINKAVIEYLDFVKISNNSSQDPKDPKETIIRIIRKTIKIRKKLQEQDTLPLMEMYNELKGLSPTEQEFNPTAYSFALAYVADAQYELLATFSSSHPDIIKLKCASTLNLWELAANIDKKGSDEAIFSKFRKDFDFKKYGAQDWIRKDRLPYYENCPSCLEISCKQASNTHQARKLRKFLKKAWSINPTIKDNNKLIKLSKDFQKTIKADSSFQKGDVILLTSIIQGLINKAIVLSETHNEAFVKRPCEKAIKAWTKAKSVTDTLCGNKGLVMSRCILKKATDLSTSRDSLIIWFDSKIQEMIPYCEQEKTNPDPCPLPDCDTLEHPNFTKTLVKDYLKKAEAYTHKNSTHTEEDLREFLDTWTQYRRNNPNLIGENMEFLTEIITGLIHQSRTRSKADSLSWESTKPRAAQVVARCSPAEVSWRNARRFAESICVTQQFGLSRCILQESFGISQKDSLIKWIDTQYEIVHHYCNRDTCRDTNAVNYANLNGYDDNRDKCQYCGCTDTLFVEGVNFTKKYPREKNWFDDKDSCKTSRKGCKDKCFKNYCDSCDIPDNALCKDCVCGCLDSTAVNYAHDSLFNKVSEVSQYRAYYKENITRHHEDSCHRKGCTDNCSLAYHPKATEDDGSCTTLAIDPDCGCLDPTAVNYAHDSLFNKHSFYYKKYYKPNVITHNQGKCHKKGSLDKCCPNYHPRTEVEVPCEKECGCTNPLAINFNPSATHDNDTCKFYNTLEDFKKDFKKYVNESNQFNSKTKELLNALKLGHCGINKNCLQISLNADGKLLTTGGTGPVKRGVYYHPNLQDGLHALFQYLNSSLYQPQLKKSTLNVTVIGAADGYRIRGGGISYRNEFGNINTQYSIIPWKPIFKKFYTRGINLYDNFGLIDFSNTTNGVINLNGSIPNNNILGLARASNVSYVVKKYKPNAQFTLGARANKKKDKEGTYRGVFFKIRFEDFFKGSEQGSSTGTISLQPKPIKCKCNE